MPDSPKNPHSDEPQNPDNPSIQKRICDFCSESTALLYCRADSAKLCLSCDKEVHSTNQLFTKHTRFQLCDGCDSSPASILCVTEHSVLCQNCDFEVHRLPDSGPAHDRRPLEGFCGCPSALELSGLVGFEGFDSKGLRFEEETEGEGFGRGLLSGLEEENDGFYDLFGWDTPAVVSIDELIASPDKSHSFQAMVVPPLPKDRNFSCGQQKQEMLHQLRNLEKSETNRKQNSDPIVRFNAVADENEDDFCIRHINQAYKHDNKHPTLRGNEARSCTWGSAAAVNDIFVAPTLSRGQMEESVLNSDRHSSICSSTNLASNCLDSPNPIATEPLTFPIKLATHELNSAERDSALSRYKEKKRTRRYEKNVRYESRKVQAEHRIRIKGRFAKLNHCPNQA